MGYESFHRQKYMNFSIVIQLLKKKFLIQLHYIDKKFPIQLNRIEVIFAKFNNDKRIKGLFILPFKALFQLPIASDRERTGKEGDLFRQELLSIIPRIPNAVSVGIFE